MAHFIDFKIGGMKVGGVNTTSGLFIGQNLQYGWRSSDKLNMAFGKVTGDYNAVSPLKNEVVDSDILDTYVQKAYPYASVMPPSPALAAVLKRRQRAYRKAAYAGTTDDIDW